MRILYYCPEFYGHHGGRAHARGFYSALGTISPVSETFLYPKSDTSNRTQISRNTNCYYRDRLWFLPQAARRIFRFFRPKHKLTSELIDQINEHGCDVLIIRTGMTLPTLEKVKKACPDTLVCLEINAAFFDEAFPSLPLKFAFQRMEVSLYKPADAFVVVSAYLKDYLERFDLPPEAILVNQNGYDARAIKHVGTNDVREEYGIPGDAFLMGYVGGMEVFRRLPEVIEYVADLRSAGSDDIYFLIVGDGEDMPAVRSVLTKNQSALGDAVKIVGWREHAEISKFLDAFDLAIFPFTNAYCSPLKLFEYLGAGLPTVGPDTSAVREIFDDGVHLKLIKQDGSNFVSTVLELKNSLPLRKSLGIKGQQFVSTNYTWEDNARRVIEHIQSIRSGLFYQSQGRNNSE